MKTLTEKQFLEWAGAHGMGLDERYPESAVLTFKPNLNLDRFWATPSKPERRPSFLSLMLKLMGEWESCFVWRHMGSWPSKTNPDRINDKVEFQILSSIGLPMGTADVIQFDRSEVDTLVTLLFSTTIFAWSVGGDVYVVPNQGKHIIKTSHHDVVHVSFLQDEDLQDFVKGMKEKNFLLPDAIPDPTFKTPKWMKVFPQSLGAL